MDFEFYNHTSPRSGLRRLLVPVQRLARRVLRPMFHRLRDLLAHLYHRQQADRETVTELRHRVAALEATVANLTAHYQVVRLDHIALSRRVVQLEEQLNAAKAAPLDGVLPIDADRANNGVVRKAS